jgi:hypothetical protein
VAAVSYDRIELLAHFADRAGITFPLLADPDIEIIETFGIVNQDVPKDHPYFGFAYSGWYLIDPKGVVTSKVFNERNNDRTTASNILMKNFEKNPEGYQGRADTEQLSVTWAASNDTARPGQRLALVLSVETHRNMYVYAQGVEEYTPIEWIMDSREGVEVFPAEFPVADIVHFPVLDEMVPVHDGVFTVSREIRLDGSLEWSDALKDVEKLTLTGSFTFQACDDSMCYFPTTIPMEWTITLEEHDQIRVPEDLRRVRDEG